MASAKSTAVIKPNLGLYLDRPSIAVPPGGLQAGNNFRIQLGNLHNLNIGWTAWNSLQLNGPVKLIYLFSTSTGSNYLIFGTPSDLYTYNGSALSFITPIYATGTVSVSGSTVTGVGTSWNTTPTGSQWANAKVGDQISFGSATQTSPTATWYTITAVGSNTSLTINGTPTVGSGSSYTIRRLFTGSFTNPWESEVFVDANTGSGNYGNGEDLVFLTNGLDNVVCWNGTSAQVNLCTTLEFTAKAICQFADVMCYLNVVQSGTTLATTMITSDAGAPLNAGAASTGIANQFIVNPLTDPIMNAKRLGSYLVIYCENSIILASPTGTNTVYAFRLADANKGVIGQDAIAIYPTIHQFIAPDGMYYFDGSNVQPINPQAWRSVISSLDHIRQNNIFTFQDQQNGEQIWSVPQTTDVGSGTNTSPNTQAWTEHYLEETAGQAQSALIASAMGLSRPYSTRGFPFTAVGNFLNTSAITWAQLTQQWQTYNYRWSDSFFGASFPILLAGDNNGYLYQLNTGQSGNGTALNSYVTFGRRALADGRMRALLRRVYPFVSQLFGGSLTITAGLTDFAMGPDTITASFSFDQTFSTQGQFMVPVYRRGRYLDLTFGSSTGNPFVLSGFDVDVLPGGLR